MREQIQDPDAKLIGMLLTCLNEATDQVIDARCCSDAERVGPLILKLDRVILGSFTVMPTIGRMREAIAAEYGICEVPACLAEASGANRRACTNHG